MRNMKIILQLTDSDWKAGLVEKVATYNLSMTSDVFEEANFEQQFDVDSMKDFKEKMEACLLYDDSCIDCGIYD